MGQPNVGSGGGGLVGTAAPAGSMALAAALKQVEVERIVGPTEAGAFVKMGSFWSKQPVVIHFLRRFGCRLCRGGAQHMSRAIPHLVAAGVRVVAIGPEPLGLEDFVKGGYWAGEVYVDDGKKAYHALQLKSLSYFQMFHQLFFHPRVRKSIAETEKVPGNFSGDGMQLGATFVLDKGGAVLLDFRQETPADHPDPEQLLEIFNISPDELLQQPKQQQQQQQPVANTCANGTCN